MRKIFVVLFNTSAETTKTAYNNWFQDLVYDPSDSQTEGLGGVMECTPESLNRCPVTMQQAGLSFFSKLPAVAFFEIQGDRLFFLENATAPFDKRFVLGRVRALANMPPIEGGGGGREGGTADDRGLPLGIFPGGNWARWWPLILLGSYLVYREMK